MLGPLAHGRQPLRCAADIPAYVNGRDGPANQNRLCVKGRFGFDYVTNPDRLKKPLIRLPNAKKENSISIDSSNPLSHFREATWEEALDFASRGLSKIKNKNGSEGLAGFGSAKCSNEEAYLFQKLIRTGFKTNNVDHCTRLVMPLQLQHCLKQLDQVQLQHHSQR